MTATETSIITYRHLKENGELSEQQFQVLKALERCDYLPTRNELQKEQLQDWEKSTISGRVNELIEKGFVTTVGKHQDRFNDRPAEVLMVVDR